MSNCLSRTIVLIATALACASASAYETCTPDNSYLENDLPLLSNRKDVPKLPRQCVETAQLTLATTGYYGYCATDDGQPQRDHVRPCISEKYVGSAYNALIDITECMGYDPRWAFSVLNLESALHINAVGAATDIGIGQLTSSAINEVNLNALKSETGKAKKSKLASCQRILPYLYEGATGVAQRCSFISLPNNPMHDLSFAIMLLKRNRTILNNFVTKLKIDFPKGVDGERVKTLLTFLGYNSGVAGLTSTLKAYLNSKKEFLDSDFDFENRSVDGFPIYLYKNFPSNDDPTRKRVSKYIAYILGANRHVEGTLGEGVCSDRRLFHTFVHTTGQGETPDDRRAVEKNMLTLAQSLSQQAFAADAQTCERLKAEFRYAFAPRDEDFAHLPDSVQNEYNSLCTQN